jgi:glyoxylase-like metal-dependent hydrolase (beta-lactamase superfamily II)
MKKLYLILIVLFSSLIASSQTSAYEVYALKYATLVPALKDARAAQDVQVKDSSIHTDFMIWLIKGNGKNILVDAGFLYGVEEPKDFVGINYLHPDSTLLQLTIRPDEITDIIVSYQHWDHVDYKDVFLNAHVWVQKEDYNYYTRMAWQKGGENAAFNKKSVRSLIDLNTTGRLTLIDGDNKEIIPGIKIYTTGSGHNSNPQYVRVKTSGDNTVLASYNVWLYYNLEHSAFVINDVTFNTSNYIKALQRIKALVADEKSITPGQDTTLFSKMSIVSEGMIKIR